MSISLNRNWERSVNEICDFLGPEYCLRILLCKDSPKQKNTTRHSNLHTHQVNSVSTRQPIDDSLIQWNFIYDNKIRCAESIYWLLFINASVSASREITHMINTFVLSIFGLLIFHFVKKNSIMYLCPECIFRRFALYQTIGIFKFFHKK